jgi:hypothetical protein
MNYEGNKNSPVIGLDPHRWIDRPMGHAGIRRDMRDQVPQAVQLKSMTKNCAA